MAGLRLDVGIVMRDFAPLDSIIQAGGRCNRNNKLKQGKIVAYKLTDDKGNCKCCLTFPKGYTQT